MSAALCGAALLLAGTPSGLAERAPAEPARAGSAARAELIAGPVSPFGVSSSGEAAGEYATYLPKLTQIGVRSLRVFGEWGGLEPRENVSDLDAEDRRIAALKKAGIEPTGMLLYAARWALPQEVRDLKTFPMKRLDAWERYVGRVVGRYADAIRYWEVWNEPNAPVFNQGGHSPADYARLVAAAHAAAKRANPRALIGITCANFDVRYLKLVIESLDSQGVPHAFDFLAVHPYEVLARLQAEDGELTYLSMVGNLRKMLDEVAGEKRDVPIRFTELGVRGLDPDVVASLLVKGYTLAIAQGVQHVQWFEAKDAGGSRGFGLLGEDLSARPAYQAYGALTDALGERPVYRGWIPLGSAGTGFGFVFGGADGDVLVAWMPRGKSARITFDAKVTMTDVHTRRRRELKPEQGIELTEKPVIITNLPSQPSKTAQANRRRPFPWGSTPITPQLASIVLGPRNVERGIVQLERRAGETVTFSDGSTGVRVSGGANNTLRLGVSPVFADYDTREVYVRVTARTLAPVPKGSGAGMNLFYQPVRGTHRWSPPYPYSNAGIWWSVPDNQRWHTKTWHLTDAMFVHTFGFSFYLQFDASVPFAIGKVEVSKAPFE